MKTKTQNKSNVQKNRKQVRREKRQQKKLRKNQYYTNRKPGRFVLRPTVEEEELETTKTDSNKKKKNTMKVKITPEELTRMNVAKEKRDQQKLQLQMQKQRCKQMKEANIEEDRNIKKLEKQLKLNKRKTKGVPKSFASDGLDYLLEVCDSANLSNIASAEKNLMDVDKDFEEDFALMTNKNDDESDNDFESMLNADDGDDEESVDSDDDTPIEQPTKKTAPKSKVEDETASEEKSGKRKQVDEEGTSQDDELPPKRYHRHKIILLEEDASIDFTKNEFPFELPPDDSDSLDEDDDKDDDNEDKNDPNEDDSKDDDQNTNMKKTNKDGTWEDIYGRVRDKDGNIINKNEGKYVPPAVRAKMEGASSSEDKKRVEKLMRLKRQLKGLLNRLAESNMYNIANQIEDLYMANSRNDMNDTLTTLILESLVSNVIAPERLLLEHIVLLTVLQANIGTEVGAHFLQTVVKKFDVLFNENLDVADKNLDNIVSIIAQLYNFKVFHSQLLYQILARLSDKFEEKHVECILWILKSVGFTLRKDDPIALKDFIIDLQKRAANASDEMRENPRVKFMLEILLAIKNNNMNKIPNYDTSYSEHLKKIMKGFIRKGNYVTQLNINLDDLLKADERGKWWVIGSAWTGKTDGEDKEKTAKMKTDTFSQKLLDLAKKQRMNTDTRRNIFCIIMSAEDYLDAFEKLLHLSLKNQQEREIIHVLLHCCLQEKKYNPYYSVLAQKFCDYNRKFQMTIKYSVWDKLKALTDCSGAQISNLAKLLTHLFIEKGLPISTLKIVEFSELDNTTLRFMRQILLGVLLVEDLEQCQGVFEKVAQSEKLKMFRESLRLFIHHFMLKNINAIPEEQKDLLQERAKLVEKILAVNEKKTKF